MSDKNERVRQALTNVIGILNQELLDQDPLSDDGLPIIEGVELADIPPDTVVGLLDNKLPNVSWHVETEQEYRERIERDGYDRVLTEQESRYRYLVEQADATDTQEVQDMLYPEQTAPMRTATTVFPNGKTEVTVVGISDNPAFVMSAAHPEFAAAMKKYGVDPYAAPGRELEEMKKYFGQGSGTYLVTVDFQLARTEAFKLDEKALKKMTKALKPAKKAPKKKLVRKPKVPARKKSRR